MIKKVKIFVSLAVLLSAALVSCSDSAENDKKTIDSYISENAEFTLTLPPSYENGESVSLSCLRKGENITMTVVSPERSRGINVNAAADSVSVGVGDVEVPLSADACAGLSDVLSALYPRSYTIAAAEPDTSDDTSRDAAQVVIISSCGAAYIREDGVPLKILCGEREISVSDYTISEK